MNLPLTPLSFIPLQKEHFPLIFQWMKEPHVRPWWSDNLTYKELEKKYLTYVDRYKMDDGIKKSIHPFVIAYDLQPIGYIQYYNAFDFARESFEVSEIGGNQDLAALDFFLGEPSYLGKGLGSLSLRLFLDQHVFKYFSTCLVDPDKKNEKAIQTYEKAGFKIEIQKDDLVIMIATRY